MCGGFSDSGDRLGKFYIDEKYKDLLKTGATLLVSNAGCYVPEFFMPLGGDLTKQYNFKHQLEKNKITEPIEKYDRLTNDSALSHEKNFKN